MKLIFCFLYLTIFWRRSENHSLLNNVHDCFYRYENNYNYVAHHLVPYCIRYNSINSNKKCLENPYTFVQLRSINITSENLWQWFASIDVIDNYAAYLLTEITNHQTEQIYCNCSNRLSFGTHCQYRFIVGDEKSSFNENDLYLMDEKW
jgi:hypothetical protein